MQAAREAVAPKGVTSQIQPEGVQHITASSGTNSSTSSSSSSSSGRARLAASSSSTTGSSGALSPQHSADAELAEAEEMLAAAASRGLLGQHSTAQHGGSRTKVLLRSVLEVAAVMFLAEWGDRSMLATVALGAAQVGDSVTSTLPDIYNAYRSCMFPNGLVVSTQTATILLLGL